MTPHEFVRKWKNRQVKDRAAAQEHFFDLCRLIAHPSPVSADITGESFTFEKEAGTNTGRKNFVDVWKRGFFGWKYKREHENLDVAYNQLLTCREVLEAPPLLVVSDIEHIVIHTNFPDFVKRVTELSLEDLLTPDGMKQLKAVFTEPEYFKGEQTMEGITEEAARQFAALSSQLWEKGREPHTVAHNLVRLIFCLFAQDVGLLPHDTMKRLIDAARRDPEEFSRLLSYLFGKMATGDYQELDWIPYFNGALSDDPSVLPFDEDALDIIERVSLMDWGSIEPSIFGTLFERSLDPVKRSRLGADYIILEDILLIVEPVLMRPLRQQWEDVKARVDGLIQQRAEAGTKREKDNVQNDIREALTEFSEKIASVKVFDPACGSGNFLYVALRQLLGLEKEVVQFAETLGLPTFFPSVSPSQLYGMELNPYAHELAGATIWIGYIQWLRDNGFGTPPEPILRCLENLQNGDAMLAFGEGGKPCASEWPDVDVIIGNVPLWWTTIRQTEESDEYLDSLKTIYPDSCIESNDDVECFWLEKGQRALQHKFATRVGLIIGIPFPGEAARNVLCRIQDTGNLFLIWIGRTWVLDGVSSRVSIVGFDNGSRPEAFPDEDIVSRVNSHPAS